MDQDAYRKLYRDMDGRICLFEKGILARQCNCSQASRFFLAEREGVHCRSDEGQQRCDELLQLLRQHTRFTLKSANPSGALPHAKVMRIQVGGLQGLALATGSATGEGSELEDIFALVECAIAQFETLDRLPFQEIIKQVAAYRGRPRRSRS
jgi:hypothetical protein